jgi:hypothetical protein
MSTRRHFIVRSAGLVAAAVLGSRAWAAAAANPRTPITVYKSRRCGCCAKWVDHLRENGFEPSIRDEVRMEAIRDELGIPENVRSCHSALVGRYLIEGHVPASDIRRLLAEHPKVAGLAVPEMPKGTPGMAAPGAPPEPYEVLAFTADGATRVYARH